MAAPTSIKFTQGSSSAGVGVAMMGATGTPVAVTNGLATPAIVRSQFILFDAPPTSSYYPLKGTIVQDGPNPSWSFTPDVDYGYQVQLNCFDGSGNEGTDVRTFGVLDANGLFIPPFTGDNLSLNFVLSGQPNTRGWAPFMEEWLAFLSRKGGGGYTVEGLGVAFGSPVYSGLANRIVLVDPTGGFSFTPLVASMGVKGSWLRVKSLPGINPASNNLTINPVSGGMIEQPVTAASPGTYQSTPVVFSQLGQMGAELEWASDGASPPNLFLSGG